MKLKVKLLKRLKKKYIFNYTWLYPDAFHQEQMSLILQCVNASVCLIKIKEHFVEFLTVDDSIGKCLLHETINAIKNIELDINDIQGQTYDNASNMKGKHQVVLKKAYRY